MNPKYRIIPKNKEKGIVLVHPQGIRQLEIESTRIAYIKFGVKCCEAHVKRSQKIKKNEIHLSQDIIDELGIAIFLSYEIFMHKNIIHLGPYIGILSDKKEKKTEEIVNNLNSYVYNYAQIGGAILVFSEEGVDMNQKLISGFLYNPYQNKWEKGLYPYPTSIFKRTGIKKKLRNHFQSLLGDSIFNNYIFNKWEFHQWMQAFPSTKIYLPDTVLYQKKLDLKTFLEYHSSIYIKPIHGSQGFRIMKLDKEKDFYNVTSRHNGENIIQRFNQLDEINDFFKKNLKPKRYILQKSLNLISDDHQTIDFRLILVKDGNGQWTTVGMIAKYGCKGHFTSNLSSGGTAHMLEFPLKNILQLNESEISHLRCKIRKIAEEVAHALDLCGIGCGNLGIDIGMDTSGCLWIIEANNIDPNHTIAIDAKDRQMFYRARLCNMLYAKKLAGFSQEV
jgi:glutathione synthase/RimK-type ligase-like ATP-grasp enzyme